MCPKRRGRWTFCGKGREITVLALSPYSEVALSGTGAITASGRCVLRTETIEARSYTKQKQRAVSDIRTASRLAGQLLS